MKILSKKEFLSKKKEMADEIKKGRIFVYPTDTIYGIGCDASNGGAVKKIRELKKRDDKPFSVIIPEKSWIRKNCFVNENAEKWLGRLPGAYTLILKLRNWEAVAPEVNDGKDSLGVRIPDNWFADFLQEEEIVFVATSVNLSGESAIKEVSEIPEEMKHGIDYAIDDGILAGKASSVVNLIRGEKIIR